MRKSNFPTWRPQHTFSIFYNLQMRTIDAFQDTSRCHHGPRNCLRQNECATKFQKSIFRWPGSWYFRTQFAAQTPLPRDCSSWAWSGLHFPTLRAIFWARVQMYDFVWCQTVFFHQEGAIQGLYLTPAVNRQPGFRQGTRRASSLYNVYYFSFLKHVFQFLHHFISFSWEIHCSIFHWFWY